MNVRPFLELVRLPAVFTAPADVLAGAALATLTGTWAVGPLLGVVLASLALYCGGMAANDLFDREVDARERPARPLPSGRVTVAQARALVFTLELLGLAIAAAVSQPAFAAAAVIVVFSLAYDVGLKRVPVLGPLVMGACRVANGLLGLSLAGWPALNATLPLLGTGLYVAAFTGLSVLEVSGGRRRDLGALVVVVLLSAAFSAIWPLTGALPLRWAALASVLPLAWLASPLYRAASSGEPRQIQRAVGACIFGIALINAALALGTGAWPLALLIVGLAALGKRVGRAFYAT